MRGNCTTLMSSAKILGTHPRKQILSLHLRVFEQFLGHLTV
jgi:hypothetical protein